MSAQFKLEFTDVAKEQIAALRRDGHLEKKYKKVQRTLGRLQINPAHPSLNSHKYDSIKGQNGEDVWDSYVENNTPSAWRVFWHYGPASGQITILIITPHP
ncbi:hypothetical protein ASF72_06985 [Arthrobacter sp. Leaf141]|uniref:hypothetical protein n=1 Tax=Arthrobacter sp. Leaf141 TaxID=1736273 RepID=UPI0006F3FD56|nr:hypothetical protein [Arthrobacter sp. Leaf141]KQR02929.1 hypothetical protein ASF72_06985 [Arthrobacter sp. Leaf141]